MRFPFADLFLLQRHIVDGVQSDPHSVAACDPRMQERMFRDVFDQAGFARSRLAALDIRRRTTAAGSEGADSASVLRSNPLNSSVPMLAITNASNKPLSRFFPS